MVSLISLKRSGWRSVISLVLIASISLALQGAGKSAAEYYKEGLDLYAKGDFQKASTLFLHVSNHVPTHTGAIYHLANCYMKLGRNVDAKSTYQRCLGGADEATKAHCQTAIDHLDKIINAAAAKPATTAQESRKSNREEESMRRYTEQVAELDKRREHIMNEAKAAAQKIRNHYKERITHENEHSNQQIKNSVTGERKTGLTSAQEDEINDEMEREIEHIMDMARQRVKGIQNPPQPY